MFWRESMRWNIYVHQGYTSSTLEAACSSHWCGSGSWSIAPHTESWWILFPQGLSPVRLVSEEDTYIRGSLLPSLRPCPSPRKLHSWEDHDHCGYDTGTLPSQWTQCSLFIHFLTLNLELSFNYIRILFSYNCFSLLSILRLSWVGHHLIFPPHLFRI